MKYLRLLSAAAVVIVICSSFAVKRANSNVYAFGFAASFKDTVVYLTPIQVLDSVTLDKTTHFLPQRDLYSYQLKNYLEYELGKPGYTCMIFFSKRLKKLEKEMKKLRGLYGKDSGLELRTLTPDKFSFTKPAEQ